MSSTAAQKLLEGQEIESRPLAESIRCRGVHVPLAGDVVSRTPPAKSTAAQNALVGQDTLLGDWPPSMLAGALHVGCGPAGFVETYALPTSSTAAHRELDAHDTAAMLLKASTAIVGLQVTALFVEIVIWLLPPLPPMTHSAVLHASVFCAMFAVVCGVQGLVVGVLETRTFPVSSAATQ